MYPRWLSEEHSEAQRPWTPAGYAAVRPAVSSHHRQPFLISSQPQRQQVPGHLQNQFDNSISQYQPTQPAVQSSHDLHDYMYQPGTASFTSRSPFHCPSHQSDRVSFHHEANPLTRPLLPTLTASRQSLGALNPEQNTSLSTETTSTSQKLYMPPSHLVPQKRPAQSTSERLAEFRFDKKQAAKSFEAATPWNTDRRPISGPTTLFLPQGLLLWCESLVPNKY